MPGQKPN